jgi:hypothetical protein
MRLKQRHLVSALVVVLSLSALGCGRGKSTVSGTVTLDGKPLSAGQIVFIPQGAPAVSGEIKDGQYSVAGVPNGEATVTVDNNAVKVLVDQARQGARGMPEGAASSGGKALSVPGMSPEAKEEFEKQQQASAEAAKHARELAATYRPVPHKYNDPNASGLKCTVGGRSVTFDVPLTSK